MKKTTLQLEDLACPSCGSKIEQAIRNTQGVSDVKILFNASKAKVDYDETITSPELIAETVEDIGYDVVGIV